MDREFSPEGYPYDRETTEQAIVRVYPAIEIVAGHLKDWPNQAVFSVIADNGTDGALVVGNGIEHWREVDLIHTPVTLKWLYSPEY